MLRRRKYIIESANTNKNHIYPSRGMIDIRVFSRILESVCDYMSYENSVVLMEADKLTPYQKAQRNRRQTVGTHTANPAKQSVFYQHAVRAIFMNLRKGGQSFKSSAKGGQNISKYMLVKNQYGSKANTGNVTLTSKGLKRNRMHNAEPGHVKKQKAKAYDYIMGIQRRQVAKQQAVKHKAASAG